MDARDITRLIDAAERGSDLGEHIPSLAAALAADDEAVVREAIWALYVATRQGHRLGDARAALEAVAARPYGGNAGVGLALDDLNAGRLEDTLARMDPAAPPATQFGVAHALTDFAERTQDRALLERVLAKLPFGIVAPMLKNGVAAAILGHLQRSGQSFTGAAVQELAQRTTDPVASAPLFGVLMAVQQRLPR